ncbi:MAG: GWxTD domain-containing protein [candidate division KSB1 bacterium]|nr:GWxTD domain-containing protein [candidate division KSB1 bacterium]MDZ7365281.1 GWxTD domain-containing protein [candidate division KSB1 bacterium]MDZ7403148.1 GWxTD domain-containing protein [candidate division KSB1 bacterium]
MKIPPRNFRRRLRAVAIGAFGAAWLATVVPLHILRAQETRRGDYQKGLDLKNAGDWKGALDAWLAAHQMTGPQGQTDFRVAIAFIELATRHNASAYYAAASEMYLQSLLEKNLLSYKNELREEIERLAPLLNEKQYADWNLSLSQNDTSLGAKMRGFWIEKDPAPTTEINERLLEHWERVAHAREHFTKASNTAYKTDDRGLIYVKFGKPDKSQKGFLGANKNESRNWVPSNFEIERQIDTFNTLPEYEVWRYSSLPGDEPIIYLFGNKDGTGSYGLRSGVEDFIPPRAFSRRSARYTAGFLPGAVLQIMFYAELRTFDPFFDRRYRELEAAWVQAKASDPFAQRLSPNHNLLRGITANYESRDADNLAQKQAPLDRSLYEESLNPINLRHYQTRFLDEQDQPKLAVTVFSFVENSASVNGGTRKAPIYQLTHTLIARDKNWREIRRDADTPPVSYDNVSLFIIEQNASQTHYTLAAEAFPLPDNTKPDTLIYRAPIAVGKAAIESKPPLSRNPASLELSDLVIGVAMPAGVDSARFPFHLIPTDQIWRGDALKCYLEIYHLTLKPDGLAEFSIGFRITRLEQKGNKLNRKEMVSLLFNFDHPHRRAREGFDIDVSRLQSGAYELTAEVTDKISLQNKQRTAMFQIRP